MQKLIIFSHSSWLIRVGSAKRIVHSILYINSSDCTHVHTTVDEYFFIAILDNTIGLFYLQLYGPIISANKG